MRGIFCVDPGQSTGLAWGIVDERMDKSYLAVKERLHGGSQTITGQEQDQIRAIFMLWVSFKRLCVLTCLLPWDDIDIIVEDFQLFPGEKPGKSTTTPERVAWGLEGYRMARFDCHYGGKKQRHFTPTIWQKPAAASVYNTRERLTAADAWIRGKQHERAAFAHMILRTNILMNARVPSTH